ncbi:wiskott-Aldrich syndrome protein family member 3 isoform X2, partial [Tachysurus ichikawai]
EQRSVEDGTLHRENRKVRKARSRRQEWNMMALDKELRPDQGNSHSVQQGVLSDSSLSFGASCANCPNIPDHAHFLIKHVSSISSEGAEHEYQSIGGTVGVADRLKLSSSLHMSTRGGVNGDLTLPPVDYG